MKLGKLLLGLAVGASCFSGFCRASTASWIDSGAPWADWYTLALSGDGKVLLAAAGDGTTERSIYVSTNFGSWTLSGAPSAIWTSLAASADGSMLFAAAGGSFDSDGIYISTDLGASWTATGAPFTNWNGVACSADGTRLVAVAGGNCSAGPIFTSTNSGATWTLTGAPITNWWSVASSPDGTCLAAGSTTDGIYISTNSGATWRRTEPSNGWFWDVTISADGQKLAAAAPGGAIYVSSDSGATWTLSTVPQVSDSLAAVAGSADGTKLVAEVMIENNYYGGIYVSSDAGTNWLPNGWPTDFFGEQGNAAVASSADGTRLAAIVGSGQIFTLTALPPSAPTAITGPAVETDGDLRLYGTVNPNSLVTWSWFDWDTSPAFANSTDPVFAGNAWNDFQLTASLFELPPGVPVYYRAEAVNDNGLSLGQPAIYEAPLVTLSGTNPTYVICGDSFVDPGATAAASPVAIAAGPQYGLVLKADQTVASYIIAEGVTPLAPPPFSNVVAIAVGAQHSLALKNDGTVVGDGDDTWGEIDVPTNLDSVVAIAAGNDISLALKSDGTVVGWGWGELPPTGIEQRGGDRCRGGQLCCVEERGDSGRMEYWVLYCDQPAAGFQQSRRDCRGHL